MALLVGGLVLRHGGLLRLALPLLVFWGLGLFRWLGQPRPRLELSRTLSARRVHSGQTVTVTVRARYLGPAVDQLWLRDQVPPGLELVAGRPERLVQARTGDRFQWEYRLRAPRGVYRWSGVAGQAQAHLSAGPIRLRWACNDTLWSLPRLEGLRTLTMAPRRTRVFSGLIPARHGGAGLEFFDTRPYVPGDEVRRIHWKATARLGRWITTQYEQERVADVAIVLDARRKAEVDYTPWGPAESHSLFEQSARAAAAVAELALSQGNRVGLLVYGRLLEWTFPGYGRVQRERVLQALAQARLGDKVVFEGLDSLPQRLFPARSQVFVVSPLVRGDAEVLGHLRARGYYLTVIIPDPVSFEARHLPPSPTARAAARLARLERQGWLRTLGRAGVVAVDWDPATPLELALRRTLWRGQR